jgi:hypothetical protein
MKDDSGEVADVVRKLQTELEGVKAEEAGLAEEIGALMESLRMEESPTPFNVTVSE